jgi:hypothetical protein
MRGGETDIADWVREAERRFAQGDIAKAEAYARSVLSSVPEHAAAQNVLNGIAALIAQGPPDSEAAGPRFLVIEAWGSGFWSDVSHVLGCLLLAEITNRIPVTHWGANSLFRAGPGDAFTRYFEPVSPYTLDDIRALDGAAIYPLKTMAEKSGLSGLSYLNRPEAVAVSDSYVSVFQLLPWIPAGHPWHGFPVDAVYRALFAKYLHPKGSVLADAEDFYRKTIAGRPAIAVHVRGSDKWSEMRAQHGAERYFEVLDREDTKARLFLLTDDLRVLSQFRARYGARVVATECQRASADFGLHLQQGTDHARLPREVMIDVFVALACDVFFGMGWSNVSAIIAMLKPWEGRCHLLGPSILMDRFVGLDLPSGGR